MVIKRNLFVVGALVALVLVMSACKEGIVEDGAEFNVASTEEFLAAIASIPANPGDYITPGEYIINVTGDLENFPGIGLTKTGVKITVRGTGSNTIKWMKYDDSPENHLFWVNGPDLVIENINLARAEGNDKQLTMLVVNKGSLEIKDGTTLDNNNNHFPGVYLMSGTKFTMSGGTLENSNFAVGTGASEDVSITINGGIIRNCDMGIYTGFDETGKNPSRNTKIVMTGGTITGCETGIAASGSGHSITVSGGSITGNTGNGIGLWEDSSDCTLTYGEAYVTGNKWGVHNSGTNNTVTKI